jgi:multidrug efflux pump subunit AcrB
MLTKIIESILNSKFKKFLVYLITLAMFAGAIWMLPEKLVKAKMLPGKDSNTFSVYVDLPKGSSLKKTKEVTECITDLLQDEEEVISSSVFLSEGLPLDFAGMVKGSAMKMEQNIAEIMVNIEKKEERKEASYEIVHRIRPILQKNCSMHEANIKLIELPAGPPTLADIVAEIYGGDNFKSQRTFAKKVASVFHHRKSLVDIDVLADEDTWEYALELNKNKIIESGITLEQVKKVLYTAFEGAVIGVINSANSESQIPLFLRLGKSRIINSEDELKNIMDKLANLKLMNPNGLRIPALRFIKVVKKAEAPSITSKNLYPMINVIATADEESSIYPLLDARDEMMTTFLKDYEVTPGEFLNLNFKDKKTGEKFELIWDGELKVTIDTFIDLGIAFIGALVLIYLLMVVYYKRFALAGAILMASFLSLIGVIVAHYVMDLYTKHTFYLTATSLIGYIGLIGINARNSLLIVDFSKQLMQEKHYSANKAIAVATATRAKPILLTVLAIVFASSLLATDAVFGGLGVALIGGTLFAYLTSLFFVPCSIQNGLKKIEKEEILTSKKEDN